VLAHNATIQIQNSVPVASSVQLTPTSPIEEDDLHANYAYSDADDDSEGIHRVRWYKNGVLQADYNDQLSVPYTATSKGEQWNFTIEPFDGVAYGTLVVSNTVVIANTAPVASNLLITPGSPVTTDELVANYVFFDADDDLESGSEIRWYRNGSLQAQFNNQKTISAAWTNRSDQWHFTVRPRDGFDFGTLQMSDNVTILNSAPEVTVLPILNDNQNVDTLTDLDLVVSFSDADFDINQSKIVWYRGLTEMTQFENETTIPAAWTNKSQTWYAIVTPYDGYEFGTPVTSGSWIIDNTAPTASVSPAQGVNSNVDTLADLDLEIIFTDNDDDGNQSKIVWFNNTVEMTQFENWTTIPAAWTNKSQIWYAIVTPYDGEGFGTPVTSGSWTVINTVPAVTVTPIFGADGNVDTDTVLSLSILFTDSDNDGNQSKIVWFMNAAEQSQFENWTAIPAVWTNKSQIWHAIVTPYDGEGFGTLATSGSWTIINTAPSAIVNPAIGSDSNVDTATSLTLSIVFTDVDNDGNQSKIVWYLNAAEQNQFENWTAIPAAWTNKSQIWYAIVTPYDGEVFGAPVTSGSWTIINTAPEATVTPAVGQDSNVDTNTALILGILFTDLDNDGNQSKIAWFNNTVEMTQFENWTAIPASWTNKSQTWYAIVTPYDGEVFGTPVTGGSWNIINAAPTASDVVMTPGTPDTTNTLVLSYTYSDIDGDSEDSTQIRWYKDNVLQPDFNDLLEIPAAFTNRSQVWKVTVQVHDGTTFGILVETSVTIANLRPTFTGLEFDAASYYQNATITAIATVFADTDQDPTGYYYVWRVNQVIVQTGIGANQLVPGSFAVFDNVSVQVWANDGLANSTASRTVSIIIANFQPIITNQAQIVAWPNWTMNEDFGTVQLNLTTHKFDLESTPAELAWSIAISDPTLVTIDESAIAQNLIRFTSILNRHGTATITLTLTDAQGDYVSVNITITIVAVSEAPVILNPNELQNLAIWHQTAGFSSFTIDLSPYQTDDDDTGADLRWFAYTGRSDVILIEGNNSANHILTIYEVATFNGTIEVILYLQDQEGLQTEITIIVTIASPTAPTTTPTSSPTTTGTSVPLSFLEKSLPQVIGITLGVVAIVGFALFLRLRKVRA
jgi:hypothetical protein